MTEKELLVNCEDKRATVIRVVHNRENPFVQLNKQALWDSTLSLKAVGLWARCMSRPNDWRFSVKELIGKCKEGRKAVDSAMNELIDAGYAYRLDYTLRREDGKYKTSGVEYVFFEFPATQEEKDQQMEIFKKSFQDCRFGDFRNGDFRKEHLLIKSSTKKDKTHISPPIPPHEKEEEAAKAAEEIFVNPPKERIRKTKIPLEFSEEVKELSEKMVTALHEANPDWLIPKNVQPVMAQLQQMIDVEHRDPSKILAVFMWAVGDSFWMDKLCKPNPAKYLREQFGQLAGKMNAKPSKNPNQIDRRARDKNGQVVDAWKDELISW